MSLVMRIVCRAAKTVGSKVMTSPSPSALLVSRAARRDPAPLSAVVVTASVAARLGLAKPKPRARTDSKVQAARERAGITCGMT